MPKINNITKINRRKKELGQVFTPENIASLMVSFFENKKCEEILDPSAGLGALLDACKKRLKNNDVNLIAVEIDKELVPTLNSKGFETHCMDFFDYDGKVDGIIMNPPYIRHELLFSSNIKENIKNKILFKGISSRANLYLYFLIKALESLNSNGRLVVIIPNTWLDSEYGLTVQQHILKNYSLLEVINFENNIFQDVDVDVSIFVIDNAKPMVKSTTNFYYFGNLETKQVESLDQAEITKTIYQSEILKVGWTFYKNKIPFKYDIFSELSKFSKINRGISTNYNQFFIRDKDDSFVRRFPEYFKQIVNKQTEIKNFRVDIQNLNKVIFTIPNELQKLPKEIQDEVISVEKNILKEKKPKTLYSRIITKKDWFSLKVSQKESLIFNYIIRSDVRFILNDTPAVVKDNFYQLSFANRELEYLYLAILNSSFSRYFIENNGRSYGSGLLKIQKYELANLLVINYKVINVDDYNNLIKLSKELLNEFIDEKIHSIDKILSKYYLKNGEKGLEDFYKQLDVLIKGRLNNEN
ncbi:HsdM family class I SAM-dependent methyltransferase [Streptococcus thermophilus]|nr:N-6 DNA methylase [Streptococcus thermophilus]MCE2100040.1 N-6 DNA methylase [Streptococcus thermophilus]